MISRPHDYAGHTIMSCGRPVTSPFAAFDRGPEEWRRIHRFENYEISNYGNLRKHLKDGRIRHLVCHTTKGHQRTRLYDKQRKIAVYVHRLVLEAFVGPCPDGMEGCHNDGNGLNNHVSNLRWDTRAANVADARKHGTAAVGERVGNSRLTRSLIQTIAHLRSQNLSYRAIAKQLGVGAETVRQAHVGKTWRA